MSPFVKNILKTWSIAIGLAFAITFLFQIPLCSLSFVSNFFEHLKKEHAFQILSAIFVLPSFGIFLWQLKTTKQRLLNCAAFAIVLIGLLPVLWVFGFVTSRALFDQCL